VSCSSKIAIFPTPSVFLAPAGVTPLEFNRDHQPQKTRVLRLKCSRTHPTRQHRTINITTYSTNHPIKQRQQNLTQ